ncbi:putative transcriptional antiterminator (BglG family) [Enterococcus florum]|uniref:Putative transcriptional antiterminator (BglG family) n=1 Tax=Enterococcus florum TaxID=2480627 RepID=A0A4P5PAY5_9ENTE|nr:BglG family transcription antiterminator [Enterococcus florum]GCF93604.1 putative transcriptional antiterminator (BglG family) [Enterococcus florum]
MLSKKETHILKLLYEHQPAFLTSQELAAALGVSDRTARKYLHLLEDTLKEQGLGTIEGKQGCGYRLIIDQTDDFELFYVRQVKTQPCSKDKGAIHEAQDRQYYILNQLFFEQKAVYVDNLADELFVSRSTISNDLVEVKKMLKPFEIELCSKSNRGIFVVGNEKNIRHFIMNYFFLERLQDNLYTFSTYTNLLEGISIEEIVIIVLDECREARLKLSDFIIFNIVLHIGLAIKRLQAGFDIEYTNMIELPSQSVEYETALKIVHRITESMLIEFPQEEANYIALHLRNKITAKRVYQKTTYSEAEIKAQLIEALKAFDLETGYQLHNDAILIDGLMMHFTPFLLRLQNQMSIENPLLEEIRLHYQDLLNLTMQYLSQMPVFQPHEITDGEWAYLTIHITAAVERYHNEQKARVLVICATGLGSSQMIKNRLEREMGSKIVIEKVISYYEIADQNLDQIDLIISSINLPNVIHHTPIVYVSVFVGEEDIKKINSELSGFKQLNCLSNQPKNKDQDKLADQIALIHQCFRPDLFLHLETASTKEEVLDQLIEMLEKVEEKPIKEAVAKQLRLRESYSSVAFSPYLAVPHPIEAVTEQAYVAAAVVPKGVYWEADYPEIQLVFLLSPDKLGRVELEKISQMLVPIIEDDEFRQRLSSSRTYDDFIDQLIQRLS